jgi:hypothetical protein
MKAVAVGKKKDGREGDGFGGGLTLEGQVCSTDGQIEMGWGR